MQKLVFKGLRFVELLVHLSVPCLAMYWFGSSNVDVGGSLAWVFVMPMLLVWFMVFIILQQHRYPNNLKGAVLYTGLTVLQFMSLAETGSVFLSSYLYFINTVLTLFILFVIGAMLAPFAKHGTAKMKGLASFTALIFASLLGLYLWMISDPFLRYYFELEEAIGSVFLMLFGMQTVKLVMSFVSYMRHGYKNQKEMVHPLPEMLLVGSCIFGAAAVPFIALLANVYSGF